jgi:hypothetical protein
MRRAHDWDEQDDHEALWQELMQRACRVPGEDGEVRPGDPQRRFHLDLGGMRDPDLRLEEWRTMLRASLERDRVNLWWLQERVEEIGRTLARRAAQERRLAGLAATGADPPRSPPPDRARLRAVQEAAALARELAADDAWLAHQERPEKGVA